jgi:hypothetical protein
MKITMQVLSLVSVLLCLVLPASAQSIRLGAGEIYQCAISALKVDAEHGDVLLKLKPSFYLFTNGTTSGVAHIVLRLDSKLQHSNKNAPTFSIHVYSSGDSRHSGYIMGEILSLQHAAIQPMSGRSPMSLDFDLGGVGGHISCQHTSLDYAFINQEIAIDRNIVKTQLQDSNSVSTVQSMEEKINATRLIDTVARSFVQTIDEALAADRTCIMGDLQLAFAALKKSPAFRSPETLVLKEGRLEFQVDQVIGCVERGMDGHGNEICKVPKIKKLGTTVKVSLCE